MITFIILLNCILNETLGPGSAVGEKGKKRGQIGKYHIGTYYFYFSVTDYVCTLLLQTITITSANTLLL